MKPHIQNIAHSHSYMARQRLHQKTIRQDVKTCLALLAFYLLTIYIILPLWIDIIPNLLSK